MRRLFLPCLALCLLAAGCQSAATAPRPQWKQRAALVPADDLGPARTVAEVATTLRPPVGWDRRPTQHRPFAEHVQWRSPDNRTRLGVVKLRLPWPLTPGQLLWFAERQYQGDPDAQEYAWLDRWDDDLGRHWTQGRVGKWDGTGYVVTRGFTGWAVYFAHRNTEEPDYDALDAAERAVRSAVPSVAE